MSKHTLGPWAYSRWDRFGDARFYIAQKDGAPYTPHFSDVATLIAETCSGELVQIQEANARLIAAAPELLEALEVIIKSVDAGSAAILTHLQRVAREAIAKATGEQQ
jgi:hypothetical protein